MATLKPETLFRTLRALKVNSEEFRHVRHAEKVLKQMHRPSFAALLPYRYYDEDRQLFINKGSIGFGLEVGAITGGNDKIAQELDNLIRHKIPRDMTVSVMLYADRQIEPLIEEGMKKVWWDSEDSFNLDQVTRNFYKQALLKGFPNPKDYPLTLRDYQVMLFVSRKQGYSPTKGSQLVRERREIIAALMAAQLPAVPLSLNTFINRVGAMINHDSLRTRPLNRRWKKYTQLNQQLVNTDFEIEVNAEGLKVSLDGKGGQRNTSTITVLAQNDVPDYFALWMGPESYKSLFDPVTGINCPFLINLTFEVEDHVQAKAQASRKYLKQDKDKNFSLAKFIPGMAESANEWRFIRDALNREETALCRYSLNVVLFSEGDEQTCLRDKNRAIAAFRRNEIEMHAPPYQHLPLFINSLPFGGSNGLWQDLKWLGNQARVTSGNVASLFPVIADTKLCAEGLLLPTYRNQLAFLDPFNPVLGQPNFNMAIAATSGGGKSVLFQSICRDVLSRNGMVWIVDLGDSYKTFCQLAGGQYLDEAAVRFNPFADVRNIHDAAEPIRDFLALLASPTGYLDDVHRSALLQAVEQTWDHYGNQARIDEVIATLNDIATERNDARLYELISLLSPYSTTGVHGHYFNASEDTLKDYRFTVLELGNLRKQPDLLAGVLFAFMLKVEAKMYDDRFASVPKLCGIDEAWQFLTEAGSSFARFIETGARTVRKHMGSFAVITQGIDDFYRTEPAKAIWNSAGIKYLLLQDSKAFNSFQTQYPNQFSEIENKVIQGFEAAKTNHFSSLMVSINGKSSFHRLFLDPVSRVMAANAPEDRAYIREKQAQGWSLERILWERACALYPQEMEGLIHE